jgi:prefoldin alpha subunit
MNQEKYFELQMLDQQMKQLQQHAQQVDEKIQELQQLIEHLHSLEHVKDDTEILAPISAGIFAKANIQNTKKLLVNVGTGINVEKDIPSIIEIIKDQIKQMENVKVQVTIQQQTFTDHMTTLQQEIQNV